MGRKPEYDEAEVIRAAARLFGTRGYAACSVDDLVQGLGVHRGSLYRAFGSKRGLFVEVLRAHTETEIPKLAMALRRASAQDRVTVAANAEALDLVVVAAWETAGDRHIATLVQAALADLGSACFDKEPPVEARRAAGLALLACRMARRCIPKSQLADHVRPLAALVGGS